MSSPIRRSQMFRLPNSSDEDGEDVSRPPKRYKSTGDDFVLRTLKYPRDKFETNDEIHESIELCPVSKALIDTKFFQRLRKISQLGTAQYIYACANHNRFQHSLGVAYLAEKMCKTIKEEQPLLGATAKDVLCVKLAGLLHDLGHGPYSHLYEAFRDDYLPKYLKENPDLNEKYRDCEHLQKIPRWSHEQSSLLFIDSILEELGLQIDLNNLDKPLRQIGDGIDANSMRVFKPPVGVLDGVLTSRDFLFIKECILGEPLEGFSYFVGRQDKKLEWLYDIVSNRHNGLDVDKIDYFARDHSRAIGKRGIDIKMITDARVAKGLCSRPEKCPSCKGSSEPCMYNMICYPDKHVATVMNFFKHRLYLHKICYQHKTSSAVETMICDILCLADPYFRMRSINGEEFPISRAYLNSDYLVRLTDDVLTLIEHSEIKGLEKAQELIQRFRKHDFYKIAVDQSLDTDHPIVDIEELEGEELKRAERSQRDRMVSNMSETEIAKEVLKLVDNHKNQYPENEFAGKLEAQDFIVKKYCMHHGAKGKNPLLRMRFFDKLSGEKLHGTAEELPIATQVDASSYNPVIPNAFQWVGVRVLVRDDSKRNIANHFFLTWMLELEVNIGKPAAKQGTQFQSFQFTTYAQENRGGMDVGSDDESQRGTTDRPVMLSQDFDESGGEETEDDNNSMFQQDPSPIPVARSRRMEPFNF